MFQRTRHPAWMFICLATLVLFSALSALAQAAPANAGGTNAAAPPHTANHGGAAGTHDAGA